jgi:hypothetical protein
VWRTLACVKHTLLALALLLLSAAGHAQDNAGIFFFGPPPTVEAIQKLAPDATTQVENHEGATRLTLSWPDVSITINIDPNWPRDLQLSGIRSLIDGFPAREKRKAAVVELLRQLDHTTTCYGSVIEPAYDRDGKVIGLLRRLLAPTGGFLFTHQSFYDAQGRRITGLQEDPEWLQ